MFPKKLICVAFILFSIPLLAVETSTFKLYGFIRNDFFYNSRQNTEAIDGLFHLFPKPVELAGNTDKNDTPQSEMLSIATRIGLDINGPEILGAKTSGKIETDLAGASTTYYMLRIRHAYVKMKWEKSELLLGQNWHPLFGSVMPTNPSFNAGAPFQPFSRSPQAHFKYHLNNNLTLSFAASYQMQFMSQGPDGASVKYMKNANTPDVYLGGEIKTSEWTSGVGFDVKRIKPDVNTLTSASAIVYTQYVSPLLQFKAKTLLGQNLTDYAMPCGYGLTDIGANNTKIYTNYNASSTWANVVYGKKIQLGLLMGFFQNLGTTKELLNTTPFIRKYTSYGYGVNNDTQIIIDQLYRIAPHVSYNLPAMRFGLEYDATSATYGTVNKHGKVDNSSGVINHRIVGSVSYVF